MTGAERQRIIRGWRRNEYIRLAPGLYMDSDHYEDLSREEQAQARVVAYACLAASSVVVGPSAARLWGFPVAVDNNTLQEEKIHLASTAMRTRRQPLVRYLKIGRSHADCIVEVETDYGTVQVTDEVTTALDLARWSSLDEAVRALDHGLQQALFDREQLTTRVSDMAGVIGVGDMREAVALASEGSESPRETDVKLLLWRMGLAAPMQQVNISSHRQVWIGRADFFYPELGLVIEYDGAGKYQDPEDGETTKAKEYDQDRDYRMNGLVTIHICDETLRNGTAEELIGRYVAALSSVGQPYPEHLWTAECVAWN
ncbi:hypothetical protein [Corynebacterium nasicanis]|uniref:DUF559 domain-containing protein n=1 Tax=Corynebacterium nasicanis TaxID=1448267 RepID=A0ABW1Q9T2_9CORY